MQPVLCAFNAHGCRAHNGATCGLKFTDGGGVERMDGCHRGAVEGGVKFTPFTGGHHRSCSQTHGGQHLRNAHRVSGEHLAQQGHRRQRLTTTARRLHGARHDFLAGITQHGTGQHVFGLGMGGHTKTRHIDADDAHTVDFFGQQLQWHTAGSGHTQIDDDDGV